MKTYEKKTETVEREVLVGRKCDLCGKEAKCSSWDAGRWEVSETEIKTIVRQKEGKSYPDGGWGTEYEIDLCPDCFKNRLITWLKSEGATIVEHKWDW